MWYGEDNLSPDRFILLGGPDGRLTTGNHSQHAATLKSSEVVIRATWDIHFSSSPGFSMKAAAGDV